MIMNCFKAHNLTLSSSCFSAGLALPLPQSGETRASYNTKTWSASLIAMGVTLDAVSILHRGKGGGRVDVYPGKLTYPFVFTH